jgi:hypothetical protein
MHKGTTVLYAPELETSLVGPLPAVLVLLQHPRSRSQDIPTLLDLVRLLPTRLTSPSHILSLSLIGAHPIDWENRISRSDNRDKHEGPISLDLHPPTQYRFRSASTARCSHSYGNGRPFPAHAPVDVGLETTPPPSLHPRAADSRNPDAETALPSDLGCTLAGVPATLRNHLYDASIEDRQHVFGENFLPPRPRESLLCLAFKDKALVR